ncbi:hypothetical protein J2X69_002059 [Algoriphagus sp. 4150]|uniref:hypothetical protein n=1 Tax=Algoriphagus sp. 4150 TaxID=2817756 RepID=UPI002859E93E|nr:hypothetical protein [Algoriphagus sp. 4150]MDR7129714.1 hypothetical protein [Algoriphagus sp. 4150]
MRLKSYLGIFFLLLLAAACINPPDNFPSVPKITFESIEYAPTSGSDSLIIGIDFQDAEGDLGLSGTDNAPPFHELDFLRNSAGELITYGTRPADAPSYNPIDWSVNPLVGNVRVNDTIWVKPNPNQYNIFVKFFIKRNGQFTEYRWQDPPFYTTFNGRFPRILTSDAGQAVEGNIKYGMLSAGWEAIFRTDTIRIDVSIQDRALNRSNEVSSPEVTLRQITRSSN